MVQKHRERKMKNETSVAMASVAAFVAGCAGVGFGQKLAISQEVVNQHVPALHALYLQDRWRMQVLNGRSSRTMLNFKSARNIFQDTAWP